MSQDELLDTVSEYADAADRNDDRLVNRLYESVQGGVTTLRHSLDSDDPRVAELEEMWELVWIIKSHPNYDGTVPIASIEPSVRRDPHTTENLRTRIKRIRELASSTKRLSEPTAKRVIWKALGYKYARTFDKKHPDALKKLSNKRWQAKLDEFTPAEVEKINRAIGPRAAGEK